MENIGAIFDFFFFLYIYIYNSTGDLWEFKQKIAGQTGGDCTKIIKINVPLKYLKIVWGTLEMPLIYCEINLIVTWSTNCVISLGTAEN